MGKQEQNFPNLQAGFLAGIKELIPPNTSLVNELSDLLEISMDSAYRRIRGETLLNIDEISILCKQFGLSFDSIAGIQSGMVNFSYLPLEPLAENFTLYHENLLQQISLIATSPRSHIVYACQDLPLFHHYSFPDLANFKVFYWKRSIMNIPELTNKRFGADTRFAGLLETGKSIVKAYSKVRSTEIWTDNTVQSTLKQIRFYWESGAFETKEDALRVCAALHNEIESIQQQAEYSSKKTEISILKDKNQENPESDKNFQLYVSEIELTNNCVLVNMDPTKFVYLGHFSFSTMTTRNELYCSITENWLNNIIRKSTLISGVSEKQRYQFFKNIYSSIEQLMLTIQNE